MNRLPIRLRLTLVFALAMAVVLLLAGSLVYARLSSNLANALDEQLRSRAQDVSALVRRDGSLKSTHGTLIERGETFAELLNMNGSVLDATNPVGRTPLLPPELARALRGPVSSTEPLFPGSTSLRACSPCPSNAGRADWSWLSAQRGRTGRKHFSACATPS